MAIKKEHAKGFIGKKVYIVKRDQTVVTGTLVQIKGNQLILKQRQGKKVKTKAFIPLVLFDLLAIGPSPYGYGYGYGGYPYGGYYGGYGYPRFF